jgi:hypothetical protein
MRHHVDDETSLPSCCIYCHQLLGESAPYHPFCNPAGNCGKREATAIVQKRAVHAYRVKLGADLLPPTSMASSRPARHDVRWRAVAIALLLGSSRSVGAVSPVEGRGGDEGIPLVLATCVQGASNQSFNLVTVAP